MRGKAGCAALPRSLPNAKPRMAWPGFPKHVAFRQGMHRNIATIRQTPNNR
jgi:hypothetical protein